jgi:CrcB protein
LLGLTYTQLPAEPAGRMLLLRLFLGVGLLGGYTTFSSFSYETYQLAERGNLLGATLYVAASVSASLLGALAGVWLGTRS